MGALKQLPVAISVVELTGLEAPASKYKVSSSQQWWTYCLLFMCITPTGSILPL